VSNVVLPSEFRKATDGLRRIHVAQVQFCFRRADVCIGVFQHRQEELVLALEVVVDQPLVDVGTLGNPVHAGAAQAVLRELVAGGQQDGELGAVGIA
jgi:hypothetical protein